MRTPTADSAAVNRLPKWARDYIGQLVRERDEATTLRSEFLGRVDENTPAYLQDRLSRTTRPFSEWESAVFHFEKWRSVEVRIKDDHLYINAMDGSLAIKPVASNAIEVRVEKF